MSPMLQRLFRLPLRDSPYSQIVWHRLSLRPAPSLRGLASVYQTPSKAAIPERLLIFHAGTPRIVFVGSLKVTTIFVFSVTLLLVAPHVYYDREQPPWVAPAVAAAGVVPLLYATYFAAPFVAYVHCKLPIFARRSREQLLKWAENIPPNTEVELTTIKSYGSLRISRMAIAELQPTKVRFGIENLIRVPKSTSTAKRPWWAPKEQRTFFVGDERRKSVETVVWQKVRSQVQKQGSLSAKAANA